MIIHCVLTSWTFIGRVLPAAPWFQHYHTISCQIVLREKKLSRTIHLFTVLLPHFWSCSLFYVLFPFLLPQPGVKLRLPSFPGCVARAPAADGPSAGARGLCFRPQPASYPPVAGLRHPEARPRHPPPRAQRERALSPLQRLLTGESGSRRLCDSSSRVIDSGVTCQLHFSETEKAHMVQAGPPLHAPISWEFPPTCVVSCFKTAAHSPERACSKQQGAC